ncbi:hypothetical protein Adt_29610 [Abeliophyllum distichum]|uniref:Uncharacterized protein n=1 Tax=Abeliophyllum distichum TaxID=126358 RepID=A0ABD1RCA6_9LAMI
MLTSPSLPSISPSLRRIFSPSKSTMAQNSKTTGENQRICATVRHAVPMYPLCQLTTRFGREDPTGSVRPGAQIPPDLPGTPFFCFFFVGFFFTEMDCGMGVRGEMIAEVKMWGREFGKE